MRRVVSSLALTLAIVAVAVFVRAQQREHLFAQSASDPNQSSPRPRPLILQEGNGEHRVQFAAGRSFPFIIKVDEQNGNAEDFFVFTEIGAPGGSIPFHMHHNAEEILILEESGATVTVGDKRAVAGPGSIVFIPRDTWVSATNTGTQSIHLYAIFSRQGFEQSLRAQSVPEGQPETPIGADERARLHALGQVTFWDTSKGPYPPGVAQSTLQSGTKITQASGSPYPLILEEADGEHRVGRPSHHGRAGLPFIFKVDGQNGNAQDFLVLTNTLSPGDAIPFHMHHNAEEIIILEDGGATVTVGDKRAVAGPRSIVFIPRETWVSVANDSSQPIHMYGVFSRQGFERYLRASSVPEGQPATPLSADELPRLRALGDATFWDTSKGPYPPGVARP